MSKPTTATIRERHGWIRDITLLCEDGQIAHQDRAILLDRLEGSKKRHCLTRAMFKDARKKMIAAEQTIAELRTELESYNGVIDT